MSGSLEAAEANGGRIAGHRGLLRRFFYAGAALALLGACSAAPEPPQPAAALPVTALPAAAPPALLTRPDAATLTGLSAAEVVALFGEPDFRRPEPPAELWQYRSADCVLDVFLYSDAAGVHVIHSEARDRSLVQSGTGRCSGGAEAAFAARTRQSRL